MKSMMSSHRSSAIKGRVTLKARIASVVAALALFGVGCAGHEQSAKPARPADDMLIQDEARLPDEPPVPADEPVEIPDPPRDDGHPAEPERNPGDETPPVANDRDTPDRNEQADRDEHTDEGGDEVTPVPDPEEPRVELPNWTQTLHERPTQLALDTAGNVVVTTEVGSAMKITKFAVDGEALWTTRFAAGQSYSAPNVRVTVTIRPQAIATGPAQEVYVAAQRHIHSTVWGGPPKARDLISTQDDEEAILLKFGADGQPQWELRYRDLRVTAIDIDGEGNIYAGGVTRNRDAGTWQHFVIQYDPAGVERWYQEVTDTRANGLNADIRVAADGTVQLLGARSEAAAPPQSVSRVPFLASYAPDGGENISRLPDYAEYEAVPFALNIGEHMDRAGNVYQYRAHRETESELLQSEMLICTAAEHSCTQVAAAPGIRLTEIAARGAESVLAWAEAGDGNDRILIEYGSDARSHVLKPLPVAGVTNVVLDDTGHLFAIGCTDTLATDCYITKLPMTWLR